MPFIQVMRQESQNAGKKEYIAGHIFGHVSAVITNGKISRSLPLKTELQKSPPKAEGKKKPDGDTLVVQMVNMVSDVALSLEEPVVVALDAYFSNSSAFFAAEKCCAETGGKLVEIVTRGQSNTVAYTVPKPPEQKKRGAPRKYGKRVVLNSLFSSMSNFTKKKMVLYGEKTDVKYYCVDLIWKPVKKQVRFVLVENRRGRCILMSTCLTLTPEEIIEIYTARFKIETSFNEQKNDVGCFSYRFWTTALKKRNRWKGAEEPKDSKDAIKYSATQKAIESHVCLSTIATGLLTVIAFSHNRHIFQRYPGWLRTLRSDIPSAAVVKETLLNEFFRFFDCLSGLEIAHIFIPLFRCPHFVKYFAA